jgi:uncharacterized protein
MDLSRTRPKRRHHGLMFLLYIFAAYVLVLVIVRMYEPQLIFYPNYPDRLAGDWNRPGLDPEDVWLTASDGTKLHAWWMAGANAKFTFVAFHGNASNIANRARIYEFLRELPVNVLAVEYRGYGHSEGKPSEAGFYLDADAGYQYLVGTKHLDPKLLVSYGQSLGTAVATHVAAHHAVGGLVLEAPFPSASRVARKFYWFLPGLSLLVRGQWDTRANLKEVTVPVLVVHCTQDPVLPFEFGQEVYDSARSPREFVRIKGDCHEEACLTAPEQYRAALESFLATLSPPN